MPVLLLCYGDPQAKKLLRRSIEARYGLTPPHIESLQVDFKGRARVKVGPVATWVPFTAQTQFVFPTHLRWEYTVQPLGLPIQRAAESYDGTAYHSLRGSKENSTITDRDTVESIRRRLWAFAALLLTPLSDSFVKLSDVSASSFEAINTQLNDSVVIRLQDNGKLQHVQVKCMNPDSGKQQTLTLRTSDEQKTVDGLMLPEKISAFWDANSYLEIEPTKVVTNPDIDKAVFTLEDEKAQM